MKSIHALASLALVFSNAAWSYTTVDLSAVANARFSTSGFINGSTYPSDASGVVTLDGVPYLLPASGNYMWHSELAGGANPRTVAIDVDVFGVESVYTLMGTWWGEKSSGAFATIEFFGDAGAYFQVELDGGAQIRDYNYNPTYTTSLDASVTKEIWNNGSGQHIDRQLFVLPTIFHTQTLDSIKVSDSGNNGFQRSFLAAVTVSPVPEPEAYALMLAGLGFMAIAIRRRS